MNLKKVARISYANTEPFFWSWPVEQFPLVQDTPRQCAQLAFNEAVIAGPLPIVECWKLSGRFEPLGAFGIASEGTCQSVLLFSKKPISDLNNVTIGLTQESSTSVVLCDVLIRERYGHQVNFKRGLDATDDAWLIIGDTALQTLMKKSDLAWNYSTDLSLEWWNWQKLPFVFARWIVKRGGPIVKAELFQTVASCLTEGTEHMADIALMQARRLGLQPETVLTYLQGFRYRLGPQEEKAMVVFRELAEQSPLYQPLVETVR